MERTSYLLKNTISKAAIETDHSETQLLIGSQTKRKVTFDKLLFLCRLRDLKP